jgi:hypothetical protein
MYFPGIFTRITVVDIKMDDYKMAVFDFGLRIKLNKVNFEVSSIQKNGFNEI